MVVIGLTGLIGMGKSTTASFFREAGIPVHDSDLAVHQLYAGDGARAIEAVFPGVTSGGSVNRSILADQVLGDPAKLKRLESLVHPLIARQRSEFVEAARKNGETIVVLDIPLLFETGIDHTIDLVVVATASEEVQRERVLARPGMTAERFEGILARQMPNSEKCRRANFIINTDSGYHNARRQVQNIIAAIRQNPNAYQGMRT